MRKLLGIASAIALILIGVGVVRPHTARLMQESWGPVLEEQHRVRLVSNEPITLQTSGDYIVFLEGPAGDPLWQQSGDVWIELLDEANKPLVATRQGVSYAFDHAGRHSKALTKISVSNAGIYELSLGRMDPVPLVANGFNVAISPAKLVDSQSWEARLWLVAGIAVGVVMGFVALSMLTKKHA